MRLLYSEVGDITIRKPYAKLLGIQRDIKYYDTKIEEVHPRHLVTYMAPREASERHYDTVGGLRKLSIVSAGRNHANKINGLKVISWQ